MLLKSSSIPTTAVAGDFPNKEGPRQVPVLYCTYTIRSLAGQSILAAKELQAQKTASKNVKLLPSLEIPNFHKRKQNTCKSLAFFKCIA